MFKGFREFIMRGNVIDLAVGIVIGVAFGAIVVSFVADILMPPIGLLLGKVDFSNLFAVLKEGTTPGPYASVTAAKSAGAVTVNYGLFINTIINFLIVALAIYFVVQAVNRVRGVQPTTKSCPFCYSKIPLQATRCPNCTSEVPTTAA